MSRARLPCLTQPMSRMTYPGRGVAANAMSDPAVMGEFIPLARAAIMAHERLYPGHAVKDAKALDLLAVALSALMALYQRDARTDEVRELDRTLVVAGRFTRGATRLEFPDRAPLGRLMVSRQDLGAALERLASDSLAAPRLAAISSRLSARPAP